MIFISVEKKIKLVYKKTKAQQKNLLALTTELKLPAEPGGKKIPTIWHMCRKTICQNKNKKS